MNEPTTLPTLADLRVELAKRMGWTPIEVETRYPKHPRKMHSPMDRLTSPVASVQWRRPDKPYTEYDLPKWGESHDANMEPLRWLMTQDEEAQQRFNDLFAERVAGSGNGYPDPLETLLAKDDEFSPAELILRLICAAVGVTGRGEETSK